MRSLIRFAAWLYPPHWRERYGSEFDALLEDIRPGWRDFLNVLKGALSMQIGNFGVTAACFAVTGVLVAGLISWRIPDKYYSSATVRFGPAKAAKEIPALIVSSTSRNSLAPILKKHNLYERERTQKPLEELIERMRADIRIERLGDDAFTVAFRNENPATARRVTQELIHALIENNILDRRAAARQASTPPSRLVLLSVPNLPSSPTSPNRPMIYGLGIAIGTLAGAVVTWFRRARWHYQRT